MSEDWQTPKFRQSVIARINEITQGPSMDSTKSATVMEGHIFNKARSKEEYLQLVTKLLMHFRDVNNRGPGKIPAPNSNEIGNNNLMQDPINALQNLASQGTRNNQVVNMGNQGNQMQSGPVLSGNVAASNLLQTLTQQRPTMGPGPGQMQSMQGIRGPIMGSNMQQNNLGPGSIGPPNNMGNQMGNTMGNMNMNPMNAMGNQGPQMANCLPGQMNQMPGPSQMQMNANMTGQPISNAMNNVPQMQMNSMNQNQMNQVNMNHPQLNQMMNRINANPSVNVVPSNVNQGQMTNTINVSGANMNAINVPPQAQMSQAVNSNAVNVPMGQNAQQMNPTGGVLNPSMNSQQQQQLMHLQNQMNQQQQQQQQQQQKLQLPLQQQQQLQQLAQNANAAVVSTVAATGGVPGPNIFAANRNLGPGNQFLRQSPSPQTAAVPSPVGLGQGSQMIPSPALVPSPSSQMSNIMANNQRNLRQSPSAPLNTPGQVTGSSPFNPQEDQLYREKYKQLTKYIEPLKRMVAKIGNDDVEKITKMNKLLEILCNPHQRIPLETLLKCEKALEKMDFKSYHGFVPTTGQFGTSNPLLEAVNATLQSNMANHTLQRTFRPCLEALFGTDIRSIPLPKKDSSVSDDTSESLLVLQREIARLDQKFKVSLDPTSQQNTNNNNKAIKLICCLDDRKLPCVPPISVTIPEDYPNTSPNCSLTEQEYTSTSFLIAVQNALKFRMSKFPNKFSLSHILDAWEMSVRQACSPDVRNGNCDLLTFFSV